MGRKALFGTFRTSIQHELVDSLLINIEQLQGYREMFEKARQAERTLEHRAEIDARTREADSQNAPQNSAPVMARVKTQFEPSLTVHVTVDSQQGNESQSGQRKLPRRGKHACFFDDQGAACKHHSDKDFRSPILFQRSLARPQ
jgi:hypothetical protein